jgi:hypothetical protein
MGEFRVGDRTRVHAETLQRPLRAYTRVGPYIHIRPGRRILQDLEKACLRRAYSVPGDAPEGVNRSTFVSRCMARRAFRLSQVSPT